MLLPGAMTPQHCELAWCAGRAGLRDRNRRPLAAGSCRCRRHPSEYRGQCQGDEGRAGTACVLPCFLQSHAVDAGWWLHESRWEHGNADSAQCRVWSPGFPLLRGGGMSMVLNRQFLLLASFSFGLWCKVNSYLPSPRIYISGLHFLS